MLPIDGRDSESDIEVTRKAHGRSCAALQNHIHNSEEGGKKSEAVASKLGLGSFYSYTSHLQEGRVFDLQVLKESVEEIKENTELHKK